MGNVKLRAAEKRLEAMGIRPEPERAQFQRGDRVRKRSGSQWEGVVVGEYSTALTPEGYAVESSAHPGSVQIYPAAALSLVASHKPPNAEFSGPPAPLVEGADLP